MGSGSFLLLRRTEFGFHNKPVRPRELEIQIVIINKEGFVLYFPHLGSQLSKQFCWWHALWVFPCCHW